MKKILFLFLLILAACSTSQDPEPIGPTPMESDNPAGDLPRSPDNGIDPGCHGGEWYETTNLAVISPWTYGEWATVTLKSQVPQLGYAGMGPVQIKYKIRNVSGTTRVRVTFSPVPPATPGTWTGSYITVLNAGSSNTMTLTVTGCPQPVLSNGWYEYQFGLFIEYQGGATTAQISGEILSVTGLDCATYPYCLEHKKANHDQGFVWAVYP